MVRLSLWGAGFSVCVHFSVLLIKRSQNFIDLQERRRDSTPAQPIERTFPPPQDGDL